jgi:hypothetical protein
MTKNNEEHKNEVYRKKICADLIEDSLQIKIKAEHTNANTTSIPTVKLLNARISIIK